MKLASVSKGSSLVEEVCARIAGAIRGGLPQNDGRLPPERELAAQLGVSRPVVREAVKRLESQGMLEVRHGVGIHAVDRLHSPLNSALALLVENEGERLRQSLEVRAVLEPEVARLAAQRIKASELRALRQLHARLENCAELAESAELDMQFHRAIARASGNEVFVLVLDSIADLGRDSRLATISHAGVNRAIRHHAAVLAALERHDPEAARRAMKRHIDIAVADLSAHLRRLSGGRKA